MSGTEPRHRDWVKLWVKEALLGTIREDLTAGERGTWYDFLLLAGNSRIPGVICANKTTALPIKRIAGILNIDAGLVKKCIKKFEESGRITIDKNGVISIVNWGRYQYSDYDRQKSYRHQEDQPVALPTFETYKLSLVAKYPGLDIEEQWKDCQTWYRDHKKTIKSPSLALSNWCKKEVRKSGSNYPEKPPVAPEPQLEAEHEILTDKDGKTYYLDSEGMKVY